MTSRSGTIFRRVVATCTPPPVLTPSRLTAMKSHSMPIATAADGRAASGGKTTAA